MELIRKMLEEPVAKSAGGGPGGTSGHGGDRAGKGTETEREAAGMDNQEPLSEVETGPVKITASGVTGPYDHLPFQRLRYKDDTIDKFWEAATDGNRLVVRWGKTGSKGQIQLKTFPDGDAARKEMEKLIKEKLGKGYQS
jgi:predicted DNA-binding WGR domain protein